MRDADALLASGLEVIDRGLFFGGLKIMPLLSGGHDSICACHVASQHNEFDGSVYHIDTGIGAKYTREFVERLCRLQGWTLRVFRSASTYENFVAKNGFPGPAHHVYAYAHLKERCIRQICKSRMPRVLVTGARSDESARRMGSVKPVQMGERDKNGKLHNRKRIWVAPCHDWTKADQQHYMDEWGLPINKLKVALGMSGECFCGAFASPGELEAIRQHAPDVASEIDRLAVIAEQNKKHCVWGTRPGRPKAAGMLCAKCDRRAGVE